MALNLFIIVLIMTIIEAWHDAYVDLYVYTKVVGYNFDADRRSKVLKFAFLLCFYYIICMLSGNPYLALLAFGARAFTFDILYNLFRHKKFYSLNWYWHHSEIYYFLQKIKGSPHGS